MTNTERLEIVAGPSSEELFDALRLSHKGRRVTLTIKTGLGNKKAKGRVGSLESGGRGGQKWDFTFFCTTGEMRGRGYSGIINCSTGKGTMYKIGSL